MKYCESTTKTIRRPTREVMVGDVGVGGKNPVRIQSMTTTNTQDAIATADQIMALADAGCEIVRVTVQGKKEAAACEQIKNRLLQKKYTTPLVADIHFYPPAALHVVDFVDKVRINPGNFADRRASFRHVAHDADSYAREMERIEELFAPLVEKCRQGNTALRIGTNHGSLSDRIMSRYGNTPEGMVESAFEYARICRQYDFHNIIFSMKASNPLVMIAAYRLLTAKMYTLGWDYPLHLGVTEAGSGIDARVKSAAGIGALLLDGLGDTIRVSLAEDPLAEIPVCKELRRLYTQWQALDATPCTETFRPNTVFEKTWRFDTPPPYHPQGTLTLPSRPEEKGELAPDFYLDEVQADAIVCSGSVVHEAREAFERHIQTSSKPLLLRKRYEGDEAAIAIQAGAEMGAALADGIAQGICLDTALPEQRALTLSFSLLQACRMRMSKTEFIACPSCGRTLFDLQSVTEKIQQKTAHLPGVKIAIMGCIVNGPGEMADADFGYVGSKSGMIDLYVEKTRVQRNIPEAEAVDRLIELIQAEGKWREPEGASY